MIVRKAKLEDFDDYLRLQESSWGSDMKAGEAKARHRFEVCLDGILVAVNSEGITVGATTMIRLTDYDFLRPLSWYESTGDGWCDTHRPRGKVFFGVDLSVAKSVTGFGTVDALMAACMQLVIVSGVKYCIWGGRMPRYAKYAAKYPDPNVYARTKKGKRYLDPQIQMYSEIPFNQLVGVIPNYFDDPPSLNNGVLWRWRNPFYRLPGRKLSSWLVGLAYSHLQARQLRLQQSSP